MAKKGRNGGEKTGGRVKGASNKRTLQWEAFTKYCLEGGLKRFEMEMNKLQGKDFVSNFLALLEYHKPKLARTELSGELNLNRTISDTTHFNLHT